MTSNEVNVLIAPESFILSILKSNFPNFNRQNFISSNTLLIGTFYEHHFAGINEKWFNVQFLFMDNSDNKLVVNRQFQVILIPNLTSEVILSEDDAFNLMKTDSLSNDVPFKQLYSKHTCKLNVIDSGKQPTKASEVKICLLNNLISVESDVIDVALLNYFKYPRFLFKDDIFCIEVLEYLPELKYTKGYNNLSTIYFKVCDIKGSECKNDAKGTSVGYVVDDTISMYQLTTQNSFLPPQIYLVSSHSFYEEKKTVKDFLKPLLPSYLQKIVKKLMDYFLPFMVYKLKELLLKPLFVISGPVGCGKTLLLSSFAKRLGIQYLRIECTSLIVGPSGFNEAKLKTVFAKVEKHLPCLLQLSNIEVLCEDREGNEDVRLVSYFSRLLREMKCDLPFFVVGTTSSTDKLSSELLRSILDVINIDNPSLEERADAISWLTQLPSAISLKVATRTSGFTLSDLTFLVSQTSREKYKAKRDDGEDSSDDKLDYKDFSVIIDRMNAQTAGAIGAPQVPSVAWTDVGGHNEIKKEIVRSLNTADFGTGLRRSGILLWGPPGTGKTLLAKAVANECKSTFLSVKGPELLNMYVGQSEQNVRQVFERAREATPCIIFFDELDSLAPNRGKGDSAGVMDRVVSQLLSEMDGLQKNDGVFVLGATNRPDLIDPALLRPGRLDKMLYVGPCEGTEAKLSVLKALTRKFKMNADIDLYKIAESLPPCLTGADLYSVCYNAWQNAARTVIKNMQSSNTESCDVVIVSADNFNSAVENLSQTFQNDMTLH